jgi:3-hydroxybutyryl-CoA dehydrogenase
MNIALIGNDKVLMEAVSKLGHEHQYFRAGRIDQNIVRQSIDVLFDFTSDWDASSISLYKSVTAPVFLNTIFSTLGSVTENVKTQGLVFGFCGLPTFFNRSRLEVVAKESDRDDLVKILTGLGLDYTLVKDEVGMVTPRVVCMIINEAYEALQQGVASKEDIDLSMKLGTNYPYGPFEWGDRIGLDDLRRLMMALRNSTQDSRFNPNFSTIR